jgi:hypothetical protein
VSLGGTALAVALAGCQGRGTSMGMMPSTPTGMGATPTAGRSGPTVVLATSELVVGRNRFAVGILDEMNRPVVEAPVTFGFYQVSGMEGTKRFEAPGTFRWVDQKTKGIYTAPVTFDVPGRWGVEAVLTRDGMMTTVRAPFEVKQQGSAPTIGMPAIRSKNPTVQDVSDPSQICTAAPPCALHTTSLDGLFGQGRPSLVLFASPGFCSSQTCAPQLDVVLGLGQRYADRVGFAHIEIYKEPRNGVLADAVNEWHLPSEPWTFFVDRAGIIVERFDGIVTPDEIQPVLDGLA